MTAFYELSDLGRSMFSLWAVFLCCAGLAGMVLSLTEKRAWYVLPSLAVFVPSYFLLQLSFSLQSINRMTESVNISLWAGAFPWLFWLLVLALLTAVAVFVITRSVRYIQTAITPLSIKYCADKTPFGICYWRDNGHVIFSNNCMNSLYIALSGQPLMNGNSFRKTVPEGIYSNSDKTWNFTYRRLVLDGEPLNEMVAWDVTEIYEKTETLRRGNEELSRVKDELRAYSLKIDDTVRRQEILQAKVNIHDEMNRLMLSTVAADPENKQEINRILALWKQNALLLCMEADRKKNQNEAEQLKRLSETLEIQLAGLENIPDVLTGKQRELLFIAANEAVTNAVKHAEAKKMKISFEETASEICCHFVNDGRIPGSEISFTGGLANLSHLAKKQNADISTEIGETFRLTLCFPKKV